MIYVDSSPVENTNNTDEAPEVPEVEVRGLWKVFGVPSRFDVGLIDQTKSKRELQDEQGLIIALADVNLNINRGQNFVIMGLSGSGKSTLLRCINRLIEPTKGQVIVHGEDITAMNGEQLLNFRRKKASMVFQHFALLPFRTILDNVAFGLELRGVPEKERGVTAQKMLNLVGLEGWGKYYPRELSGGMQQRVGLARALTTEPDILLLDEPFSALDPLIRREMQDEFLGLTSIVQKTVIFVTHDLNEALKLGDEIAIMQDGKIIQLGSTKDIVLNPANDYVREFVRDVPKMKVLAARGVMERPGVVAKINQSPETVRAKMIKKEEQYAYIVDDNEQFRGIVTRDDLESHSAEEKQLAEIMTTKDLPIAELDTMLEELVNLSAVSGLPVIILGKDKKLKGIVPVTSIMKSISDVESK